MYLTFYLWTIDNIQSNCWIKTKKNLIFKQCKTTDSEALDQRNVMRVCALQSIEYFVVNITFVNSKLSPLPVQQHHITNSKLNVVEMSVLSICCCCWLRQNIRKNFSSAGRIEYFFTIFFLFCLIHSSLRNFTLTKQKNTTQKSKIKQAKLRASELMDTIEQSEVWSQRTLTISINQRHQKLSRWVLEASSRYSITKDSVKNL